MSAPGPLDPNDPLLQPPPAAPQAGGQGYQAPPPYQGQSYYQPTYQTPRYGYYGQSPQDDDEFKIHWPKNKSMWAIVVVLTLIAVAMFVVREMQTGSIVVGFVLTILGVKSGDRQTATTMVQSVATTIASKQQAVMGRMDHVANRMDHLANDVHVTKEGVRSILNDPAMPGTPGHMERLEGKTG